jgi:hypothetical protein
MEEGSGQTSGNPSEERSCPQTSQHSSRRATEWCGDRIGKEQGSLTSGVWAIPGVQRRVRPRVAAYNYDGKNDNDGMGSVCQSLAQSQRIDGS